MAVLDQEVISPSERFGLHGMKRKGITDTKGTKGEKQLASSHMTQSMLNIYDQEVPMVNPAGEEDLKLPID